MKQTNFKAKRVMAISSGGGHWTQLTRLRKAFEGHQVTWVTIMGDSQLEAFNIPGRQMSIPDATRWNKFGLIRLFLRVLYCIIRIRPHVIITTGAAPGFFALVIGRIFRIKTCWIDSIANVEKMSLSGQQAEKWADLWLTQWKHLGKSGGPEFHGCVLPDLVPELSDENEELSSESKDDQARIPEQRRKRILAISSGGGHWVELLRIKSALTNCDVHWATVRDEYRSDVSEPGNAFHLIPDATRWNKIKLLMLFPKMVFLIRKVRPDVIITTGAAPGYFAVMTGSLLKCKTCWIDSLANVEKLSLSGEKARKWSDIWLTQWQHLAEDQGPSFKGGLFPDLISDPENEKETSR